jgi:hypothetical protein
LLLNKRNKSRVNLRIRNMFNSPAISRTAADVHRYRPSAIRLAMVNIKVSMLHNNREAWSTLSKMARCHPMVEIIRPRPTHHSKVSQCTPDVSTSLQPFRSEDIGCDGQY